MDKLYLRVVVALDMWRHEDQLETFLFEGLACNDNIVETRELFTIIDKAAVEMQNYAIKHNHEMYHDAEKEYRAKNFSSFWVHSHKVIRNMSIDSPELRKLMLLRAKTFYDFGYLENAINDYEMLVYIGQQNNNTLFLEELGLLMECYCDVADIDKFEKYFILFRKEFNKELKIARSKRSMKKNSNRFAAIKQFEDKIRKFESMLKGFKTRLHSKNLGETVDIKRFKPYLGYKGSHDPRISSASVCCTVLSEKIYGREFFKVTANRNIPRGEIIAYEKPMDRHYFTPTLQCEYCYELTTVLYTCFKCHQKYYCGLECLKSDDIHHYECNGMRNGFLYSLEATMLFRLFIRSLSYIKKYVFCKIYKAADINDFFEVILDGVKYGPQSKIKSLLTSFDNYDSVEEAEVYSMATHALRIAIYAVDRTSILEDFFINVKFEKHELLIFLASLLLRLQNQIKINSLELGSIIIHPENLTLIDVKLCESDLFNSNRTPRNDNKTIYEYCDYSKDEACGEGIQLITTYASEKEYSTFNNINRSIPLPVKVSRKFTTQAYIDNICGAKHEFTLEDKLNIAFRATKEILHLRMYTYNSNISDGTTTVTMQAAFPTIAKFANSCEFNAVPILLENGSLLIKAGSDISRGEEITLCYTGEYRGYSNPLRKQLQHYFKIRCNCKYCTNDIDYWTLNNAVFCYDCNKLIYGEKCENCGIEKVRALVLYEDICRSVRKTANKTHEDKNEVKALKYIILLYQIHSLMYPETNTNAFVAKLDFAKICVQKNFVYDAFEVLEEFYHQIPDICSEWHNQNLVFQSVVLDKLVCMLNGNISFNKSYVLLNFEIFYKIWLLANEIANKLIYLHDFLEIFNFTTYTILTQYQLLIQLKFLLFDFEYNKNLPKFDIENNENDEMPNLCLDVISESSNVKSSAEECVLETDCDRISFFVRKEDLVETTPLVLKSVENEISKSKEFNINFISPDMTGNDNIIEEVDLKTMFDTNSKREDQNCKKKKPSKFKVKNA